ncbi:oligosaccharide flippase family protein [Cellulomonas soli]|uniref:oligosaccharide flippase family protein n=1 Tax=Cellulomonas soli TaxID=931535 RepID=UPI003F874ABE
MLSLIGGAASGVGMFVLNIVVARSTSPSGFADFAFFLALSQVWFILTVAGLELAAPRLLARHPAEQHGEAVGSILALASVLALVACLVAAIAADPLAGLTKSSRALVVMAAAFGIATGWRAIGERMTAAVGRVGAVAAVKSVEASIIVTGALAAALLVGGPSWSVFAGLVVVAAFLAVGAYLALVRHRTGPWRTTAHTRRQLVSFARYAAPTTVFAVAIVYIDKFAMRIGGTDLQYAQYSAYFSGSVLLAAQAVFVLQSVVLPATVRAASGAQVRHQIFRLLPLLAVGLPVLYMCSGWTVLKVLGPNYHYLLAEGVLFACWATLYTINILGMTACVGRSSRAMRRESLVLVARVLLAAGALGGLIAADRISITSVVLVMVTLELCETANVVTMMRRYLV